MSTTDRPDLSLAEALEHVLGPIPPLDRIAAVAALGDAGATADQIIERSARATELHGRPVTLVDLVRRWTTFDQPATTSHRSNDLTEDTVAEMVEIWRREALDDWERQVPRTLRNASLPEMHRFEPAHDPDVLERLEAWCATRPTSTLILFGDVGSGKTHAAWAVAKRCAAHWWMRPYGTGMASLYTDLSEDPSHLRHLLTVGLLILDDVGTGREAGTDHRFATFQQIIHERDVHNRPTILTTNLTGSDLTERLGGRITDRLMHHGISIQMHAAESRRRHDNRSTRGGTT